ncbi:hypothetical protein [Dyella sp.]|uniref:hypothetical protein n=1 Tax=Dyella sp. TaxID=1869338 RepID=UPI002D76E2E9|nr:hypothetical protein [Dyella sp.]HET6433571.1 hypothetical protein [Dyella sp.]
MALIVAGACTGTVQARQNSADGGIKHDGKAVGKDIGHGARTVGHETRRLAIKVGHGARDAGKGIGHGARDGWNATRKAVKGIFEHD